jgi:hypothetical protein
MVIIPGLDDMARAVRSIPTLHHQENESFPPSPILGSHGWEFVDGIHRPRNPGISSEADWWPPVSSERVLPGGGGYRPWYGWGYPRSHEDDDLRERLIRHLADLDDQLATLADDDDDDAPMGTRILVPELLPPDWQSGEIPDRRRYSREGGGRREESAQGRQDRGRHVHFNFASDLDFGVRRRIIGILDRAEHRRIDIFGSEAFRTSESAMVRGRFVERGTDAWVIRLDSRARLEMAKEAIAEGFRLVSFDETSLSFIHRPTFPWKPILLGAGAGAAIMGAGVFTGWIIWGRKPPLS